MTLLILFPSFSPSDFFFLAQIFSLILQRLVQRKRGWRGCNSARVESVNPSLSLRSELGSDRRRWPKLIYCPFH